MKTMGEILKSIEKRVPQGHSYEERLKEILNYPEVQEFINNHRDSISQEMIANSFSRLNEYVLELEAMKAGRPGQNPGYLPQLFINYHYIDITYAPSPEFIRQQAQAHQQSLIDNRTMSLDVRQARLQDYDMNNSDRIQLMGYITDFIEQIKTNPLQARGLFISGPFGVGKTYLLGALANSLAGMGFRVKMVHYPTFVTDLKSLFGQDNRLQEEIRHTKSVDILILDDLGAESNTTWVRDEILGVILEHRMKEFKPTFFTSNFNFDELEAHLAMVKDGHEMVKAKRIMERIRFLAKERVLTGPNRRHSADS